MSSVNNVAKALVGAINNIAGSMAAGGDVAGAITYAAGVVAGNATDSWDAAIAGMKAATSVLSGPGIIMGEVAERRLPFIGVGMGAASLTNTAINVYNESQRPGGVQASSWINLAGEIVGTAGAVAATIAVVGTSPVWAAGAVILGAASIALATAAVVVDGSGASVIADAINSAVQTISDAIRSARDWATDAVANGIEAIVDGANRAIDAGRDMATAIAHGMKMQFQPQCLLQIKFPLGGVLH